MPVAKGGISLEIEASNKSFRAAVNHLGLTRNRRGNDRIHHDGGRRGVRVGVASVCLSARIADSKR